MGRNCWPSFLTGLPPQPTLLHPNHPIYYCGLGLKLLKPPLLPLPLFLSIATSQAPKAAISTSTVHLRHYPHSGSAIILTTCNWIPEAALMARSYLPSKVLEIVSLWRKDLKKVNQKVAESLVDPEEYSNLFEDWQIAFAVEAKAAEIRGKYPPASEYVQHANTSTASLVEIFRNMQMDEEETLENGDLDYEINLDIFPIYLGKIIIRNRKPFYINEFSK